MKNGFVLTSSRDEKVHRPTLEPKCYQHHENLLVYPKDELANGTWISASNKGKVACLLNGAYKNHEKGNNYRKSRGLILLECFEYESFEKAVFNIGLEGIEPFTLLLVDYNDDISFFELVWDGEKKHIRNLDNKSPQIWSSATLYPDSDRLLRKTWFEEWINKNGQYNDHNILNFHTTKHGEIDSKDILMKRENNLQTVSVSQVKLSGEGDYFFYSDLINGNKASFNLADLKCTQELQ